MSEALAVDFERSTATKNFLPRPPILTSYHSNWKDINLAHYRLPAWEIPEIASPQHTICLAAKPQLGLEMFAEGRRLELFPSNDD
jgi:AraC family transcriptional regulator